MENLKIGKYVKYLNYNTSYNVLNNFLPISHLLYYLHKNVDLQKYSQLNYYVN